MEGGRVAEAAWQAQARQASPQSTQRSLPRGFPTPQLRSQGEGEDQMLRGGLPCPAITPGLATTPTLIRISVCGGVIGSGKIRKNGVPPRSQTASLSSLQAGSPAARAPSSLQQPRRLPEEGSTEGAAARKWCPLGALRLAPSAHPGNHQRRRHLQAKIACRPGKPLRRSLQP